MSNLMGFLPGTLNSTIAGIGVGKSQMTTENNFLSRAKFTAMVESNVYQKRMTYMDAILYVCEDNKIEPEDVRKFVSKVIKEKLEAEARALNYLPRTNSLPLA
jgi:hypothetical protein